ncbi:FixH family protein [Palleronia abyssalis]|uniref:Nitrogen fixation protein FixH n=1 Tax=Palleronia abyssalis TaxID=1501240 RepID=A0A2R8BRT0_9RHOB|nr:FixH family protein [Palleronia abyssalis]SPJ22869.1 hypothetical protein PAA8504_00668 [Palleronia abyssalis]
MTALTGKHVAAMFVTGFGIIIGVNLTLATQAVRTFPGLEVANSYVASQSFDARRAAQQALGWTADVAYGEGRLSLDLTGPDGGPADVATLALHIERPTEARDDRPLTLDAEGGAALDLDPGVWRLDIVATAADGTAFEQRVLFEVPR